jgi:FKBP-type peptidyl-prolyl cis-trans isomerase FklB
MKKALILLAAVITFSGLQAQELKNYQDSLSYAVGILWGQNIKQQGLEVDATIVGQAIGDVLKNEGNQMDIKSANEILKKHILNKQETAKKKNMSEGMVFLTENAKRKGVTALPSGLQYEVLKEGTGAMPKATDKVTVHYTGTLVDGTVFDSSVQRGEPATFPVNGVIKGWVEALQLMKAGSKWKLFIPQDLAYGERGSGSLIGPYATLVFEVELLEVK